MNYIVNMKMIKKMGIIITQNNDDEDIYKSKSSMGIIIPFVLLIVTLIMALKILNNNGIQNLIDATIVLGMMFLMLIILLFNIQM